MAIYIVSTNYFSHDYFGTYSTIKRARLAFEDFLATNEDIVSFEDCGGHSYQFTTKNGATFDANIYWDILDNEFETGEIKEDK